MRPFHKKQSKASLLRVLSNNIDVVKEHEEEEKSMTSASDFDESEIMSITDSMHLAKGRGVPLSNMDDDEEEEDAEDLVDSVHLTRQRVPQCIIWNESNDEMLEESLLVKDQEPSRKPNHSSTAVRFGSIVFQGGKSEKRSSPQKQSRRMLPVFESS